MMRLVCLLLISFAMGSNAIATVKSKQKNQNTGEIVSIEDLSQLFYPADVLNKFKKIRLSMKNEHCEMRGNLRQLSEINVPKKYLA